MNVAYLDLADFLAISELVLEQPAEEIARAARLELAESPLHAPAASFGGIEFYPDLAVKAALLCTRPRRQQAGGVRVHDRVLSAERSQLDSGARRRGRRGKR